MSYEHTTYTLANGLRSVPLTAPGGLRKALSPMAPGHRPRLSVRFDPPVARAPERLARRSEAAPERAPGPAPRGTTVGRGPLGRRPAPRPGQGAASRRGAGATRVPRARGSGSGAPPRNRRRPARGHRRRRDDACSQTLGPRKPAGVRTDGPSCPHARPCGGSCRSATLERPVRDFSTSCVDAPPRGPPGWSSDAASCTRPWGSASERTSCACPQECARILPLDFRRWRG